MILFATNDAGPAAYLSQIIDALGEDFRCVSSEVSSKVFSKYGTSNQVISLENQAQYDDFVQKKYSNRQIKLIVGGTSWGDCLDKAVIKFGRENQIKVISVIEHWSWYRQRFEEGDKLRLPDYILVNDEFAKFEAVACGLPAEIILPLGNPVLENRSFDVSKVTNKASWLKELNIPDKKIVTFVSEEYLKDFPVGSPQFQGFTEFQVVEDILWAINEQFHLLIKLHPMEDLAKYARYKGNNVSVFQQMDIPALTVNSDFIIGLGSMLLLEMSVQRQDILSYRPHDLIGFVGNSIGVTTLVADKGKLVEILRGDKKVHNFSLKEKFNGSTKRIVNFIKGQLS